MCELCISLSAGDSEARHSTQVLRSSGRGRAFGCATAAAPELVPVTQLPPCLDPSAQSCCGSETDPAKCLNSERDASIGTAKPGALDGLQEIREQKRQGHSSGIWQKWTRGMFAVALEPVFLHRVHAD